MLDGLGQIKNPIVRSVTVAEAVFSAVTLMSAVILMSAATFGWAKVKEESAHKIGVYMSVNFQPCRET